jgi:integrase
MEHLAREQVVSLLTAARAERERDWVLLLVTFWHGLRASEAVNLTPANFISEGYLDVQRLKGSLRTVQPLVEHELEILNERAAVDAWVLHKPKGDRLFPISRVQFFRLMRRYGSQAGLPRHLCHPHVLKHSIAMQSIKEAGIENVRQYLGHKSISSTGAYLKVGDDAASRAIAKATRAPREPEAVTK